ncbi:zinc finger protein 431-like [Anoplophora glabripennis]|uniref:zinc finger protein 431-like n=1 Tax=Anoplophora glabripennis TaxID=217634 RepID=UPI000873E0BE|nr:zinc finger protein 431-like [Anoplophora glabripennis]
MGDSKAIFCRLCNNPVSKGNFTVIDEATREILRTVSLNLDLDDNNEHVMCSTCSVKLYSVFDFKSTCLYVEDKIANYVNPKVSFVDLREVYSKEHENKSGKVEDNEKICRLCLQLVRGFVPFYKVKLEIIHRYIPEVDFGLTEDPLICNQCLELLVTHDSFIKACLNVEIKVQNAGEFEHNMSIKNEIIETGLGDEDRMEGSIKIKQELNMEETPMETEEVNIKSEGNIFESGSSSHNLHNEMVDSKNRHIYKDVGEIKKESMLKCEIEEVHTSALGEVPSCNSEYENDFNSNLKCEAPGLIDFGVQMHKCNMCDYETKSKDRLNVHQLSHKDPLEIQMYKCDACSYESKYKHSLKYHQLTHKDPSEIHMYKCDVCTFQTKYKHRLKYHHLTHKDPSEIQMYKCDACSFETKYKRQLKLHQLIHRDSSQIQMFKCDVCTYETRYKNHLKNHQLTHKDPSEIQMYKCDVCHYESKYKHSLKYHQLLHKDPSEIHMYKCDTCTFETKHKHHLKCHELTHKDSSVTHMYKCDICTYETKYKSHLKDHQLTHKDPSEVPMYKCDTCAYETKYKKGLRKHRLMHENPSTAGISECDTPNTIVDKQYLTCNPSVHKGSPNVQVYKCNDCVFETRHKDSLRVHALKHQDPSKVPMYKCDKCVFQTRHKHSLVRHQLTHNTVVM